MECAFWMELIPGYPSFIFFIIILQSLVNKMHLLPAGTAMRKYARSMRKPALVFMGGGKYTRSSYWYDYNFVDNNVE